MSRAAKATLAASLIVAGATVWGVHYMQIEERRVMHRGVERDEQRQAEKRRQRALDLEVNKEKEKRFQEMQPTKGWLGRQQTAGNQAEGDVQPNR